VKILFFGTSLVSKLFLEDLYKNNHEIFIITIPDKHALRGQKLIYQAVKIYAIKNNISFIQPAEFTTDIIKKVGNFDPDAGIAIAYGKLIPEVVFNIPKYKTFNIHFSLLPKYRGASPVQYALCNGEAETGVSSFHISEKFDTGNIIIQEKLNIDIRDNAKTLFNKLIPLGVDVMNKTLKLGRNALLSSKDQSGCPSFAPLLKKEDGLVDWRKSAGDIYNQFRGLYIWPGTYSIISQGKLAGKRIKFIEIEIFDSVSINKDFGTVHSIEKYNGFTVLCAVGKILVVKLQPENKDIMAAWNFVQGGQLSIGDYF
jgi:methionyl-tRNA formyltransferase